MALPIILNPAARSDRARTLEQRIRELKPEPEVHLTQGAGDAERLAFDLASAGHAVITAAGGDGTVNEVIHGLARHHALLGDSSKHAALGVLPSGTMNVFALEIGLPGRDLDACWERIQSGARREVDLWMANDLYFAQLAGVGLDAEIVEATTSDMKRRFGPLSYALAAMSVLAREAPVLTVHIDGRPPMPGSIVLIGNGRHYGGPVPVFPQAKNDDGLLDILVFHERRSWELLQLLHSITTGKYDLCGDLDYVQAAHFRVESEQSVPFEIDGELGQCTPVEFKAAPFKLIVAG
jgi:diacylglycerol kinase (ATP)